MTGDASLVTTPEELEPSWLAAALIASGAAPAGARLEWLEAERIGAGRLGHNIRYRLGWAADAVGATAPASVVAKFASDDATSRQTGLVLGIYAREVGFYRDLASSLPARIPHCHYVAMNDATGDFLLLLEDLVPARVGDQLEGCSPGDASAALSELALLHGARWGDGSLSDLPWLAQPMFDSPEGLQAFYQALLPGFIERYGARLGDETVVVAERFAGVVADWAAPTTGPTTVLHGDYRLDNLLFGPEGSRVAIVDWQTVSVGEGIRDASYFLGAGLVTEDRRAHEVALLREYHDAVSAVTSGSIAGAGFGECWERYRHASFGGLLMAVVASSVVGGDARSDEMFCVMAERHATQATDLEAFDLIG